jgi:hypothetical protein
MPQEVIDQVNQLSQLGKAEGQPELLTFYDRKGRLIGDTKNEGVPPVPHGIINHEDGLEECIDEQNEPPIIHEDHGSNHTDTNHPTEDDPYIPQDPIGVSDATMPDTSPEVESDPYIPSANTIPQVLDQGVTLPRRSTRVRSKLERLVPAFGRKSYDSTSAVTTQLIHPDKHIDKQYVLVAHYIMTQYSMKAGMRKFKKRGEDAISKELSQLHYQDTFEPVHPKHLSFQERKEVLESHLFLKEKRDTYVKGRKVAGGNT